MESRSGCFFFFQFCPLNFLLTDWMDHPLSSRKVHNKGWPDQKENAIKENMYLSLSVFTWKAWSHVSYCPAPFQRGTDPPRMNPRLYVMHPKLSRIPEFGTLSPIILFITHLLFRRFNVLLSPRNLGMSTHRFDHLVITERRFSLCRLCRRRVHTPPATLHLGYFPVSRGGTIWLLESWWNYSNEPISLEPLISRWAEQLRLDRSISLQV